MNALLTHVRLSEAANSCIEFHRMNAMIIGNVFFIACKMLHFCLVYKVHFILSTFLSPNELKIMRNEIFARYGYTFKTKEMIYHFRKQRWYRPMNTNVTSMLTSIEKENGRRIQMYEK